jgi:two-component system LytT family sensor kinase
MARPGRYNGRIMIRNLVKDQGQLFWALHVGGWFAWGLFGKYAYTRALLEDTAPGYFIYVMIITLIALVLSLGLRHVFRRLFSRPVWVQVPGLLLGSAAAGYLWLRSRTYIYLNWFEKSEDMGDWLEKMGEAAELYQKVSYMETFVAAWTVMLAWSVLYFLIKYYQVFQEVQKSALKSAAMAHEAQLKMLRYQLNPHFLFNTLNAISTLVLEQQTAAANHMVTRLSSFLRHSLDNDPMQKVTLEQELAALKLYLDIEKVRFEDRLTLELDIEGEAAAALIPSLLLQPLVENAIKYGIARSEEGGRLRIAARVFAGDLLLELSDDGPGVELVGGQIPNANGVGLRNTQERLAELYGDRHSFRLAKTEPHGLTISIRIPFEAA